MGWVGCYGDVGEGWVGHCDGWLKVLLEDWVGFCGDWVGGMGFGMAAASSFGIDFEASRQTEQLESN